MPYLTTRLLLRSCPFCNERPRMFRWDMTTPSTFSVVCDNCHFILIGVETEEKAAICWNTRLGEPRGRECPCGHVKLRDNDDYRADYHPA